MRNARRPNALMTVLLAGAILWILFALALVFMVMLGPIVFGFRIAAGG